jgi:hypothetical protein
MTRPQFRKPTRISITVSFRTYSYLVERSQREGRSMSNLASFLLESTSEEWPKSSGSPKRDVA